MAYEPQFAITPRLLSHSEKIAALRERILQAAIELSWMPALQKDCRSRNVHASTAIEGNPLTLEQVRALEEGRSLAAADVRSRREVLNYFAGLRYVEKRATKKAILHSDTSGWRTNSKGGVLLQNYALDGGTPRPIAFDHISNAFSTGRSRLPSGTPRVRRRVSYSAGEPGANPAAASVAPCWRAPWSPNPTCCCSTNPPTTSTSTPSNGCSTSCATTEARCW